MRDVFCILETVTIIHHGTNTLHLDKGDMKSQLLNNWGKTSKKMLKYILSIIPAVG